MYSQIPVLRAVDAALCGEEVFTAETDRFYLLFADRTAALISASGVPDNGATVAVAAVDGRVWLGVYRKNHTAIAIEGIFSPEKISCHISEIKNHIRWIFPVLQINLSCVDKKQQLSAEK